VKSRTRHDRGVPEWRVQVHLRSSEPHRPVPVHPVPRANGRTPLAFGVPGQSEPRKELIPHGTVNVFSAGILRVARETQARGGVHEYFAMHVLSEVRGIEML